MFDEQPDGDPHGECVEEIHRLGKEVSELRAAQSAPVELPEPIDLLTRIESARMLEGWKEACIAWEVCASVHSQWAKGKDALFSTCQADYKRHAEDARAKALAAATPQPPHNAPVKFPEPVEVPIQYQWVKIAYDEITRLRAELAKVTWQRNEARADLAASQAKCGLAWQPIETAPTDGARILLCGKGGKIADGYYGQPDGFANPKKFIWPYIHANPTHWMLLPEQPESAALAREVKP